MVAVKSFWVEMPEGLVWPNFGGRIRSGSIKGSFLPLKDCGLRQERLVMQTHLTVIRSATFDTPQCGK